MQRVVTFARERSGTEKVELGIAVINKKRINQMYDDKLDGLIDEKMYLDTVKDYKARQVEITEQVNILNINYLLRSKFYSKNTSRVWIHQTGCIKGLKKQSLV